MAAGLPNRGLNRRSFRGVAVATLSGSSSNQLLVEDQEEVRRVANRILTRFGYHVIEARNAGEALLTCEQYPRTIPLLLTDVVMPLLGGRQLAERLVKIRPNLKVLFMSANRAGQRSVRHPYVSERLLPSKRVKETSSSHAVARFRKST